MNKSTEQLSYEVAYAELQQIVQELQGETVSIDELAAKIARAQELIRFCRERLKAVETEIGKVGE
ncbi:MAG: exodeoxyribonuclease VII small subunit [Thermoanaerobaculia bacterium]|nr:exodeoxyribonuclease VII small subunit [Thermoanaerobaculia bacterium]